MTIILFRSVPCVGVSIGIEIILNYMFYTVIHDNNIFQEFPCVGVSIGIERLFLTICCTQ